MNDIFFFDKMLTPKIITIVYWFMLLSAVFSGLGMMFGGMEGGFIGGLIAMVVGLVGARIVCELLIVLFKMNEALQELRTRQD